VAKTAEAVEPTVPRNLTPDRTTCPHCGRPLRADYANRRTVHTLDGLTRLHLLIRRCHHAGRTQLLEHCVPRAGAAQGERGDALDAGQLLHPGVGQDGSRAGGVS
jgi:hypothetical protein